MFFRKPFWTFLNENLKMWIKVDVKVIVYKFNRYDLCQFIIKLGSIVSDNSYLTYSTLLELILLYH